MLPNIGVPQYIGVPLRVTHRGGGYAPVQCAHERNARIARTSLASRTRNIKSLPSTLTSQPSFASAVRTRKERANRSRLTPAFGFQKTSNPGSKVFLMGAITCAMRTREERANRSRLAPAFGTRLRRHEGPVPSGQIRPVVKFQAGHNMKGYEGVVCERNRDPSRTTTFAGGVRL